MKINVDQLRTFVAIVDAGGIHRAASRINLSQPAASRQINALEATLGITLFDRIGRRLKLTSEAEGFLPMPNQARSKICPESMSHNNLAVKGFYAKWYKRLPPNAAGRAATIPMKRWRFSAIASLK